MKPSINEERFKEQLKQDEGFKPRAYWDRKQWTVGYGTKGRKGGVITKDAASKRLDSHINIATAGFQHLFNGHEDKFNDVRAEAFMNMLFNMGLPTMSTFTNTLASIKNTDKVNWDRVADNLKHSLWYRQVGDRAKRIVQEIRTGVKV